MERRARKAEHDGEKTKLFEIMEKHGRTRLTSGVWATALVRGDKLAQSLIDEAVEALGAGIGSVVNVLDIGAVVIGGGLGTRFGEPYVERIAAAAAPHLFVADRPPAFLPAELGDQGGAIGAALLVAGCRLCGALARGGDDRVRFGAVPQPRVSVFFDGSRSL